MKVDTKMYCKENGEIHRDNGPAVIVPNEKEEWYQDGKLHRKDGPAIEYADGNKKWYWYGKKCDAMEWNEYAEYYDDIEAMILKGRYHNPAGSF